MSIDARAFAAEHGLQYHQPQPLPSGLRTVADALVACAEARPDTEVVVDRHRRLTGAELLVEADRVAATFDALGCRPLDRVAASLPNSIDVVTHFLGAMRAGLVWVGVNRALAPPEKAYQVADGAVRLVVTEAETAAALRSQVDEAVVIGVDDWAMQVASAEPSRPATAIDPYAPAVIAYTSGTTGRPKGAVHSQHNLLVPPSVIVHGDAGRRFVQGCCLPLTIINMQVLSTVQTLLGGGSLVVMDRIDVLGVVEWVRDEGIERIYATPPLVHDLLSRPDVDRADLVTLEHLVVGGAKAPTGLNERFIEWFGEPFSHGYGLTEAPTGVTTPRPGEHPPEGSAGAARLHVDVSIRNAEGEPVGSDVDGEICLSASTGGPFAGVWCGLLGYWDQPEATAATIVDGVIHSADVGSIDADGYLYVRDRRSELIIRGGANVYPAEVERVIEAVAEVAEAAVVGRPDDRLGEEVVAFVLARPGHAIDVAALDAYCRAQLARYKVPVTWYGVEDFPRNAMSKVVKPRLREWLADDPTVEIVAEVLNVR